MKKIILLAIVLLGMASAALAQSSTGSVSGQIFDPKQAVVANASVSLKNKATGAERTATANGDGSYAFPVVPPGAYTVTVTATGFEKATADVQVAIAQDSSANITLQLQGATATVEVVGDSSAVVQTDSPQLSTVVSSKQLSNLPTVDRNPYSFISLQTQQAGCLRLGVCCKQTA